MDGRQARRAASRLGVGIGITLSALAAALGGALLVFRAVPLSEPVQPTAVTSILRPTTTTTTTAAPGHAVAPLTSEAPPATVTPQVAATPLLAVAPTTTPKAGGSPALGPVFAASVPAGSPDAYVLEVHNTDGSPGRWDPCSPIHYVVNLTNAPPTAAADLAGAIERVETATGMTFISDGTTIEIPSQSRPNEEPDRYGHRWAPLLIAWVHTGQSDFLAGDSVLGEGGANWVAPAGGRDVFVTGQIAINADTTSGLASGFGGGVTIGELLLHEFGHVMGLAHSADPNEVMYARLLPRASAAYASGDLTGLHVLASGGCEPPPAAS